MPDAGQQPHHEQVQQQPRLPDARAAHREIDIVPEPAAERDVPAVPELREGAGDVGIVEVLLEAEAEHRPKADGHVGIAGEIVVELQGVGHTAEPGHGRGDLPGRGEAEARLPGEGEVVGEEDLLAEAAQKAADALLKALLGDLPLADLGGDAVVADDGARDELREEGDVEPEIEHTALHLGLAAVHVDAVAHGLEGKEGDADGERDLRHSQLRPEQGVEVLHGKAEVFEMEEDAEVENDREHEPKPFAPRARLDETEGVVDRDGQQHQEDIDRLAPGVEEQARDQEKEVARPGRAQQPVIRDQHAGQEDKQKDGTGKQHGRFSPKKQFNGLYNLISIKQIPAQCQPCGDRRSRCLYLSSLAR